MNYSIMQSDESNRFKITGSRTLKLAGCVLSCLAAGLIGSIYVQMSVNTWYKALAKPWFNPPASVFAPVWTILFVLMGISVFIVWDRKTTYKKSEALLVFYIQLAANICWSIAFFGICSTLGGLIMIIYLLASILWTIHKFYALSKTAAFLLVPYLLWVCFAILNISIYYLNL